MAEDPSAEASSRGIEASRSGRWFLKEPNLHWIAPRILEIDPDIRFVMAVRHGIDMAFSTNQQQLVIWSFRAE